MLLPVNSEQALYSNDKLEPVLTVIRIRENQLSEG